MSGGYNNRQQSSFAKTRKAQHGAGKGLSKKTKKSIVQEQEREIRDCIEKFVKRQESGEGYTRLGAINDALKKYPNLRPLLMAEVKKIVLKKNPCAEKAKVKAKHSNIKKIISEISYKHFSLKTYESVPYLLKSHDFQKMLFCKKNRIYVDGEKIGPIFRFLNNYIQPFQSADEQFINAYTDNKFYINQNQKMVFAKSLRQAFRVHDVKKFLREFDTPAVEYDRSIAQRCLSVSMYNLLDGSEKSLSLFARIDDDGYNHKNLLIDERRRAVYGERAGYPHFHFQNETDQYLCRKDSAKGYKTGRCNAIDIPHIIDYLRYLENLSPRELKRVYGKKENLDMPFLRMLVERGGLKVDIAQIMCDFIKEQDLVTQQLCQKYYLEFFASQPVEKVFQDFPHFKSFVCSLMFLQQVSDDYWSDLFKESITKQDDEKSLTVRLYKQFLSNLEMTLMNEIMNAICNVSEKPCREKSNRPYFLKNDFDEDYAVFQAL